MWSLAAAARAPCRCPRAPRAPWRTAVVRAAARRPAVWAVAWSWVRAMACACRWRGAATAWWSRARSATTTHAVARQAAAWHPAPSAAAAAAALAASESVATRRPAGRDLPPPAAARGGEASVRDRPASLARPPAGTLPSYHPDSTTCRRPLHLVGSRALLPLGASMAQWTCDMHMHMHMSTCACTCQHVHAHVVMSCVQHMHMSPLAGVSVARWTRAPALCGLTSRVYSAATTLALPTRPTMTVTP